MPRLSKIGAAALAAFGWTGLNNVSVNYLVVAGGGGGGGCSGSQGAQGGGGAGGLRSTVTNTGGGGSLESALSLSPLQSYTVTVGAGGVAGIAATIPGNGGNSVFSTITSTGGGAGGSPNFDGQNGGSGGGGSYQEVDAGTGTSGQGFAGGPNTVGTGGGTFPGGGGGGAGAVGANGDNSVGRGNGGAGVTNSISGSSVTYAGGGGGGANGTAGVGGAGGGGAGGNNVAGTNGTANLGGGGGGCGNSGGALNGGNGGSGIVIISYVGAQQFGGGVVTVSGGNTIHTFTTSGTLSPLNSLTANFLVVAGGAGGGEYWSGGGGGAGGLRSSVTNTGGGGTLESALFIDTNSIYTVTVGGGGAGVIHTGTNTKGANGSNSAFLSITSTGGGAGGVFGNTNGNSGGSGGGGFYGGTGGAGTANQGRAGGAGASSGFGNESGGGGGGGAGTAGAAGAYAQGGNGGDGVAVAITGSSVTYGGGAGGSVYTGTGGTGGSGGGADGVANGGGNGKNGTANTGGGASGTATNGFNGGNGGSGVVIISYPGSTQQMAGGTVTVAGGNVIHTFTSSGYLTPIVLVNNSLRFRASANAYLNRTPTNAATSRRIMTYSVWAKIGTLGTQRLLYEGYTSVSDFEGLVFNTSDQLEWTAQVNGGSSYGVRTPAVFRDPSAWYHIVCAVDTTQATSTNRVRIYVNGVEQTGLTTFYSGFPPQNEDLEWNNQSSTQVIGWGGHFGYYDGYMAEINMVDGTALTPNSFGTSNSLGSWQPIRYGGSYGTNGFYLPFTANTESYAGFFGGSGYSIETTATQIIPATGDFTIEAMINFGSLATYPVIACQGTAGGSGRSIFLVNNDGTLNFQNNLTSINSAAGAITTNRWYYVAVTRSGANSVLYINGVQVATNSTTFGTIQNTTFRIGVDFSSDYISSGYVSNVRVSNVVRTISPSTAPTTNFTNDASTVLLTLQGATVVDNSSNAYALTNNGTVTLGKTYPFAYKVFNDQSPQGNNWTPNNISGITGTTLDYMTDVPTLTSATTANYGTLNPLWKGSIQTLSNGNLTSSKSSGTNLSDVWGTFGMTSGKWYFECSVAALSATVYIGIGQGGGTGEPTDDLAVSPASYYYGSNDGNKFYGNTGTAYGNTYTAGDVIGCAIDMDNGKIWWSKNGTWQASGDPAAGTNAAFTDLLTRGSNAFLAFSSTNGASNSNTLNWNFGQQPFSYTPPTGFNRLNTFNFSTPTVTQSNKHFDITLYTGNGSQTASFTNSGLMQPDMVWSRIRIGTPQAIGVFDSVRGTTGQSLDTAATTAEGTWNGALSSEYGYVSAFNSNGFSVNDGSVATTGGYVNFSGRTYVAWQWRASNATAVTNTAGTIASTVSANTTAGFSIVTYTGTGGTGTTTVGHGCQVGGSPTAPSMVIIKRRNASANWAVYLTALTSTSYYLVLNSSNPQANYGSTFISPSSSTLTIAADSSLLNTSTGTYVAYCFAEVAGYSKFGSYTGNGAGESNGPFIYCGFRPALIIIKVDTAGYNWAMMDIERPGYNSISYRIFADTSNEETTTGDPQLDFLSNGFKLKAGNANYAGTIYFMAFAENPFKYSNAR